MRNQFFSEEELIRLFKKDKDILRVELRENDLVFDVWTRWNRRTAGALKRFENAVRSVVKIENEIAKTYESKSLIEKLEKAQDAECKIADDLLAIMKVNKEVNLRPYLDMIWDSDMICLELFQTTSEEALEYYNEGK